MKHLKTYLRAGIYALALPVITFIELIKANAPNYKIIKYSKGEPTPKP